MNPHQDLLVQTSHLSSHLRNVNNIDYCFKLLMTMMMIIIITTIIIIIVSITKLLMVIGSPCTYLSCNRRMITWLSDYRCPICSFLNRTPVIGYPCDFHVSNKRFIINGFLSNIFNSFQTLG